MNLTHSCIITADVKRLRTFYRDVLQIQPVSYGENYAEFATENGTLALFALAQHEKLAPGSMNAASNRSIVLEFRVDDVDGEYARLKSMEIDWVKPPTTQSWGNRSTYFRDPDGNLVSFYCPLNTAH